MTFKYQRIEHNLLLELLEDIEFANSLAYMIEYKNHTNLNITPHEYSIELSNDEIAISIILYVLQKVYVLNDNLLNNLSFL